MCKRNSYHKNSKLLSLFVYFWLLRKLYRAMKGAYTRIEMATMAGYNRSVLINTSIASPVALTVDIEDEKIF